MSYSANDNQNYFVQAGRSTSRVLSQPGGKSSFSLGGWTPEELERQRLKREGKALKKPEQPATNQTNKENLVNRVEKVEVTKEDKEITTAAPEPKPKALQPMLQKQGTSSNAFASGANMNSVNVITDRPTSRVSRPPGGHSSIRLW